MASSSSARPPALASSSPASSLPAATGKRKAEDLAAEDAKKPKANGSITAFFSSPASSQSKTSTTSTTTSKAPATSSAQQQQHPLLQTKAGKASSFDKDAWVASLTAEKRELLALEIGTLDESWLAQLTDVLESAEFLELKRFLRDQVQAGKKVFPPSAEVYSWSRHTPLHTVKAVVLGQDPYHGPNQAHGLCFSVKPPTPAPPSLRNIYIALKKDYPTFRPPPANGGLLTPWADRGVLLLNACLTVEAHKANSHAGRGWERLTQRVLDIVARERRQGVVFLAWGSPAQKRLPAGLNQKTHLVLKTVHPSPLSASRGFFDCGHFKKTNEWLAQRYGSRAVIDWDLNVHPSEAGV